MRERSVKVLISIFLCFSLLFVGFFVDYYRARALAISSVLGIAALTGMLIAGGYLLYNNWNSVYPLLSKTWDDLEENVKDAILLPVEAGKGFIAYSPSVWGAVLTSLSSNKDLVLQESINEAKDEIIPIQFTYTDEYGKKHMDAVLKVGHQYRINWRDYMYDSHNVTIRVLSSVGNAYYVYLRYYEEGYCRFEGYGTLSYLRFSYYPQDNVKYKIEFTVYHEGGKYSTFGSSESVPRFYDDGVVVDTTYDPSRDDVQVTIPIGDLSQDAQKRANDTKVSNPRSSVSDVSSLMQYLEGLESVNQELYRDLYDLENQQTDLLGQISSTITGVTSAVTAIATALTDGLVGNVSQVNVQPLVSVGSVVRTKFPFSLPFDIYNCISGIGSNNDLPALNFGFYDPISKKVINNYIDLDGDYPVIMQIAPFVRAGLLLAFTISLVYGTRRLLGGAE